MKTSDLIKSIKKIYPETCGVLYCRGLYKEIPLSPLLIYYLGIALGCKNDEEIYRYVEWSLKEFDKNNSYIYGEPPLLEGNAKFYGFTYKLQKERVLEALKNKKEKMKTEGWSEF